MPAREVLDGVLVIFGGAFLLTPGFITDIFGIVLLLPPTRALVRGLLVQRFADRMIVAARTRATGWPPAGGARPGDVDGTARDVDVDPSRGGTAMSAEPILDRRRGLRRLRDRRLRRSRCGPHGLVRAGVAERHRAARSPCSSRAGAGRPGGRGRPRAPRGRDVGLLRCRGCRSRSLGPPSAGRVRLRGRRGLDLALRGGFAGRRAVRARRLEGLRELCRVEGRRRRGGRSPASASGHHLGRGRLGAAWTWRARCAPGGRTTTRCAHGDPPGRRRAPLRRGNLPRAARARASPSPSPTPGSPPPTTPRATSVAPDWSSTSPRRTTYPRRGAGEVTCGTSLDLGRLRLDCAFFAWTLEGREGIGRYDVLRRA